MQLDKIIVKCSPSRLPYSLPIFLEFANRTKNIVFDSSVHIHSDARLNDSALREKLLNFLTTQSVNGAKPNVTLTLIYTNTKYLSFCFDILTIDHEITKISQIWKGCYRYRFEFVSRTHYLPTKWSIQPG